MTIWLLILIFMLIILIWVIVKKPGQIFSAKNKKKTSVRKTKFSRFQGVTIKHCANACVQSQSLKGKRFLASEVPSLPVQGCSSENCTCSFIHHDDRRSGELRRYPGLQSKLVVDENRFNKSDRRKK